MYLGENLGVYKMFFKMSKFTLDVYTGPLYKFFWKNKNKKNSVFGRNCNFAWKNSDLVRETGFAPSVQIAQQTRAQMCAIVFWPLVGRVTQIFAICKKMYFFDIHFLLFHFLKMHERPISGIFATFYVLKKGSFFSKKKFRHAWKTPKKFPLVW